MPPTTTTSRDSSDERLQLLLEGLTAVRSGDFSTRLPLAGDPLMDQIATVFNGMNDQLALFTSEVTRVATEVGTDGKLGGQASVPGAARAAPAARSRAGPRKRADGGSASWP